MRQGIHEFWYVKMRQAGVLVLTLQPKLLEYDKIRITCSPDIAQDIADWWQGRK